MSSSPKATYINLAVIRPLAQVLQKIFDHVAESAGSGVFRFSHKPEARKLLERLFNQNEQSIGLFYLQTEAEAGIAEPAVAFLRVTVALRTEHYERLRSSRVGRLSPEFRAKLGWLIGNLYVRPATPDWGDKDTNAYEELIKEQIGDVKWIEDEVFERAKVEGIDLALASPEALNALRPPSKLDRALEEIDSELRRVDPGMSDEIVTKIKNRLRNNGKFAKLFRLKQG